MAMLTSLLFLPSESYNATFKETQDLVNTSPEQTVALVYHIFAPYHISPQTMEPIITRLQESPQQLQCFIMKFYHNLPPPRANRALTSAITIALGYFMGGFVPLLPYFFVANNEVFLALWWSVLVMAIALFTFGYVKTCIVQGWMGRHNVWSGVRGGGQMVVVGGLAAGAAMGLVKAFE
jgi:vacuolar iron transporter family protein